MLAPLRAAVRNAGARASSVSSAAGPAAARRGYAADAHGEAKVAYPWLAPTEPAKWKEEHTVFVVLGGWAVVISSAMKIFGGGKKEAGKEEGAAAVPAAAAAAAAPAAAAAK